MPALDPFSGASRPMLPFDTLPSQPLAFAATLHPIDINTPALASSPASRLPKPRKIKESVPTQFPVPPYVHSRHASTASLDHFADMRVEYTPQVVVGSDEWMQEEVAKCVDGARRELDLKGKGLSRLSNKIADLRDLVTLASGYSPQTSGRSPVPSRSPIAGGKSPTFTHTPQISPGSSHFSANSRSFNRTVSAPVSSPALNSLRNFHSPYERPYSNANLKSPTGPVLLNSPTITEASDESVGTPLIQDRNLLSGSSLPPLSSPTFISDRRPFLRSKTGSVAPMRSKTEDCVVILSQNFLTSLPSALFEISNLTVLILRSNQLTELPAAIGNLVHLRELNIGLNKITSLPSTILDLRLQTFSAHPNPYITPPTTDSTAPTTTAQTRILSPLVSHSSSPVRRLSDICINFLISPHGPGDVPPLLEYDWVAPRKGLKHPLLDATSMHEVIPNLAPADLSRMLQAVKSGSQTRKVARRDSVASVHGYHQRHEPTFPKSHSTPAPDDAAINPFYYPCPSPRHNSSSKRYFLHPAEERHEWRDVHGIPKLPIRWKGCSPGCLAFLEQTSSSTHPLDKSAHAPIAEEDDELWGVETEDMGLNAPHGAYPGLA